MKELSARKIADRVCGTLDRIKYKVSMVADDEFSCQENICYLEEFLEDIKDVQTDVETLLEQQREWHED